LFATLAGEVASTGLTPASGRQDHTTSPSAGRMPIVADIRPRPPPPAPNVVTMRNAPPEAARDGAGYTSDLHFGKTEIFFVRGLDKRPRSEFAKTTRRANHPRQSNAGYINQRRPCESRDPYRVVLSIRRAGRRSSQNSRLWLGPCVRRDDHKILTNR